jgi:hypothetical protein
MSTIKTYDKKHIADLALRSGIKTSVLCMMDKEYVYIDDAGAPQFFWELSTQVIDTLKGWQAEYRDCDKYSRVVQALGQMSHAMQWGEKKSNPAGLALGVFNYRQKNAGGHSINCMITKVAGEDTFKFRYFEPQTAEEIFLLPEEIQSAFLVLL